MKKLLEDFKNIDMKIIKIMKNGFKFSFITCLIFTYILYYYALYPTSHFAFEIGILGVKCSFMFFASFFIGAIASNEIFNKLV